MIVYAVVDDAISPDFPLGDSLEVLVRREDVERFIEELRGDDHETREALRIEEREPTIPEDADGFTREVTRLGVPADLIDVTRGLVDGNLAGAALTSALTKLIAERPGLVSPGFAPPAPLAGLEGGQRSPREPEPPADMNALIRAPPGRAH